jgi:hypothetical protein
MKKVRRKVRYGYLVVLDCAVGVLPMSYHEDRDQAERLVNGLRSTTKVGLLARIITFRDGLSVKFAEAVFGLDDLDKLDIR